MWSRQWWISRGGWINWRRFSQWPAFHQPNRFRQHRISCVGKFRWERWSNWKYPERSKSFWTYWRDWTFGNHGNRIRRYFILSTFWLAFTIFRDSCSHTDNVSKSDNAKTKSSDDDQVVQPAVQVSDEISDESLDTQAVTSDFQNREISEQRNQDDEMIEAVEQTDVEFRGKSIKTSLIHPSINSINSKSIDR